MFWVAQGEVIRVKLFVLCPSVPDGDGMTRHRRGSEEGEKVVDAAHTGVIEERHRIVQTLGGFCPLISDRVSALEIESEKDSAL